MIELLPATNDQECLELLHDSSREELQKLGLSTQSDKVSNLAVASLLGFIHLKSLLYPGIVTHDTHVLVVGLDPHSDSKARKSRHCRIRSYQQCI